MARGFFDRMVFLHEDSVSITPSFILKIRHGSNPINEYRAIFSGPFTLSRRKLFLDNMD
jgi:hypothetical protein